MKKIAIIRKIQEIEVKEKPVEQVIRTTTIYFLGIPIKYSTIISARY